MNRTIDSFLKEKLKNTTYLIWSVIKHEKERSHKISRVLAPYHLQKSYINSFEIEGEEAATEMMNFCIIKYGVGEDFELEEIERTI
jgi:hypothetical protein